MNLPYSKMDLQIAVFGMANKIEKYEADHGEGSALKKLEELGVSTPPDGAEFNAAVAAHNGISTDTLVSSPNYLTLKQEYSLAMANKAVSVLVSEFGMSDKEAWAALLHEHL